MGEQGVGQRGRGTALPTGYLEGVCVRLTERNDRRGLIRLVERWSEAGEPTRRAQVLQARALVDLCLMDRAWVRLNEVINQHPDDIEAMMLAAEMFVERGWPVRARKLLRRVRELDEHQPDLDALDDRAQQPPLQPAANAREIEQSGSPEDQLALAERFQSTGSFLRSKSILERLRRNHPGPWDSRVDDLLWALSGEFAREEGDPVELARSLVPEITAPPEDGGEFTESVLASEVTSVGAEDSDEAGGDGEGPAFPALFRRLEADQETETASEVTAVSLMADRDKMVERLLREEDDEYGDEHFDDDDADVMDYPEGPRSGDTQIMLVVHKDGRRGGGGEVQPASQQPAHRRKDEDYNLKETLNLREYQANMGMEPTAAPAAPVPEPEPGEGGMEEEDEDLIVVTRRELDPAEDEPNTERAGPVEVVEKPIVPIKPPPPVRPAAPEVPPPVRPPPPELPPEPEPVDEDDEPAELLSSGQSRALRVLVAILVVMVVVLGVMVVLVVLAARNAAGQAAIEDEVLDALGAARVEALDEAIVKLAPAADERGVGDTAHAGLAALMAVRWLDYSGAEADLAAANAHLRAAHDGNPARGMKAVADASLALVQGDAAAASAALTYAPPEAEITAVLKARASRAAGDPESARRLTEAALERHPGSSGLLLERARSCREAGDVRCVRAALTDAMKADPGDSAALLMDLELRARSQDRDSVAEPLEALLASNLQPRLLARAELIKAELAGPGEARRAAIGRAVAADPSSVETVYAAAALRVSDNDRVGALDLLLREPARSRGGALYQASLISLLMELDREDEAKARLRALPAALREGPDGRVLEALITFWSGPDDLYGKEGARRVVMLLEGHLDEVQDLPRARYLLGLGYGAAGRSVDAQLQLLDASALLRQSSDPFHRLEAARALAAAAVFGREDERDRHAKNARLYGTDDPMVRVFLGRYWEQEEREGQAAEHFDRAADLGPDFALVQYARGLYYARREGFGAQSRSAWNAYLRLEPTGARARRVKELLDQG